MHLARRGSRMCVGDMFLGVFVCLYFELIHSGCSGHLVFWLVSLVPFVL